MTRRSLPGLWCRWRLWTVQLIAVTIILHLAIIGSPAHPVFDEQHYIPDAESILAGQGGLRAEHPPLGRLLIAAGLLLCGDNPWGWRLFSVIFGTLGIVLFYLLCRQLNLSEMATFLATFLLSFENLTFIQSSVAMLDVFSATFMLLSFVFHVKGRYLLSALSVGLSALAKLSGALALPVVFLHWLLSGREHPRQFIPSLFLAPASFLLLMIPLEFLILGRLTNPLSSVETMLGLTSTLTWTNTQHPGLSRPWDWLLRPLVLPYCYQPHYLGALSFTLWALTIPCVIYMTFKAKRGHSASLFGICWFAGTYLLWIPISLITDRITFVYYFYPTVGAICIGLASGLSQLLTTTQRGSSPRLKRMALLTTATYLALHLAVFIVLSPLSTWWSLTSFT